jgi:hypothetical protein
MDGLMDRALGEAPHPQQPLLQFFEIAIEMSFHGSSVLPLPHCARKSRRNCEISVIVPAILKPPRIVAVTSVAH